MSLSRALPLALCLAAPATAQEAFTWVFNSHSPFGGGAPALDLVATQTFDAEQAEAEGARVPRGLIWARCAPGGAAHIRFEAFTGAAQAGDTVAFQMTDDAGTVLTHPAQIFNAESNPVGGPEITVQADGPEMAMLASVPVVRYGVVGLTDFNIAFDLSANQSYVSDFITACAGSPAETAPPPAGEAPVAQALTPDLGPDVSGHTWTRFTQVDAENPAETYIAISYAVPETDDVVISGECIIGERDPFVRFEIAADISGLQNGTPVQVQARIPDGRTALLDGTVTGVGAEFGISGIAIEAEVSDPAWLVIAGDRTVRFDRPDTGNGFTITGNGPNSIGPFLADCAEAAQLDALSGSVPSAPIDASPGFLACENYGRVSSRDTGTQQVVNFINSAEGPRRLVWIRPDGELVVIIALTPGQAAAYTTDPGHIWMVTDEADACMEMVQVPPGVTDYRIRTLGQ